MTEILRHLYLGSLRELDDPSALRQRNITGIINCCALSESELCPPLLDFECLRIYIQDMGTEPIHDHFNDVSDFIDAHVSRDESVLIHCKSGVSRSATLVLAYLVLRRHLTLRDAFFLVLSKRPIICPNVGFMKQLCDLEICLAVSRRNENDIIDVNFESQEIETRNKNIKAVDDSRECLIPQKLSVGGYSGAVYCEPLAAIQTDDDIDCCQGDFSEDALDGFRSFGDQKIQSSPVRRSDHDCHKVRDFSKSSEQNLCQENSVGRLNSDKNANPQCGSVRRHDAPFQGTISLSKYISWYTADRRQRMYSPNLSP